MARKNRDVFINCPFDNQYQDFFRVRSGFRARSALETDDGSQNRFEKICRIVGQCRYGVHDISRTEADARFKLPRFNKPLELGVFFGAKYLATRRSKRSGASFSTATGFATNDSSRTSPVKTFIRIKES